MQISVKVSVLAFIPCLHSSTSERNPHSAVSSIEISPMFFKARASVSRYEFLSSVAIEHSWQGETESTVLFLEITVAIDCIFCWCAVVYNSSSYGFLPR